ncbi:alpha/beta hydrolase [Balneolaceae bacterium ANBcel3]|nr:alpha/beta hydrolase [Balneolaceae bacterium ANBcel3]
MTNWIKTVTGSTFFWIFIMLGGGYLLILLLMYLLQASFVYYPSREITTTPQDRGLDYEDVKLKTSDGIMIHGWYVPASQDRATLLFFHGNAGNVSHRMESITLFHELGLNVLIIDYRGYGNSKGTPSEKGTYEDARAAWNFLTQVKDKKPESIILFGRSLGGGIASWLATQTQPAALVLEASFTSAPDLASELYPFLPVNLLMHIRYPVLKHIANTDAPVMVLHSKNDEIIPFHHGKRLYEEASEPKRWLEMRGGHNDGFIETGDVYITAWEQFISDFI